MTARRCERSRVLGPGIARTVLVSLSLAATVAACSSDDDATASTSAPPAVPATVAVVTSPSPSAAQATPPPTIAAESTPPTTTAATTTTPTTPTTPPDGAGLLQQSFDALAPGYHFVTNATVNGTPALTAEGDQIAGSTRMTVTSQGKAVDYVVLPDGTWVAQDGTWQELDSPAPVTDPIAALRAPQSVTVASYAPPLVALTATYPPGVLGLAGDQPVSVSFELDGAALQAISYATPDGASAVRTDISGVADATPITSPSTDD